METIALTPQRSAGSIISTPASKLPIPCRAPSRESSFRGAQRRRGTAESVVHSPSSSVMSTKILRVTPTVEGLDLAART